MPKKRIIDKRKKEKYIIDDEYLNGMARLCGWQGTIVYNSLCRHASKEQECFPSLQKMAEQHGVNRKTILKGVENLEKRSVIKVEKKRTKSGQWLNNIYILLDKTEWDYTQVPLKDTATQVPLRDYPSPSQGLDQVPLRDTKETHSEGNTSKETHTIAKQSFAGNEINQLFNIFYEFNPTINYANKTQRSAAHELIKKFGLNQAKALVQFALSVQATPYAPRISTPLQLKNKLGDLKAFKQQEEAKQGRTVNLDDL